ncbi:NPCBM/NEW2 domain-containing protein [Sulfoacidibacillus ferrooxidans]|uniref:Copper amine oxidase-like N-terminal domain-containing protein n=1 Tax=Sulfoacidibacillus ferrooxidans TaxID=2005001 RepID=A0A9X2ADI6_9BACL|nr:hypothetical protein [Sulfoacidibacillus ferrooxidans]
MKRQFSIIAGVVTSAFLFGGVSYASVGIQQIQASFHNIQLIVDGKTIATNAQPFIYNKNVYVPIYTVGNALGANVQWINNIPEVDVTGKFPAATTVPSRQPLSVWINGNQMPDGVIGSKGQLYVPAGDVAYQTATGLMPTVNASGNLDLSQVSPTTPEGTLLTTLSPSSVSGDFSNSSLYPGGHLTGFYAPTVLGKMYSGPSTVEWGITTSESAVIPQVTYSLHGQYQTLSGMFAVDDITRNFGGAAQLVFVGDGKVLSSTGWVQGGSAPVPFSIPVTGVNTLQIQYQLKDANGTVYSSGDTYQAPSVNADQVSGPVVFTDLIQPTLSEAATVTVSTSNSASTVTRRIK